ncbi:MAG: aminotransferase class I/II-fold pyridoxal phosphate-dependent enzyme [Clostridiales bacterium]|nr:aminotransferase class I/II-fold pyridoxal phosphate-dependent enzyme [Clostridiales bacterium]
MKYTSVHGGDLDAVERELHIKREDIIDFSGNVNPLGVSERVKKNIIESAGLVSTYPDRGYLRLREEISRYTGAKTENILVGNGSTELIGLIIKAVKPKNALILAPCYSEYEREVRLAGGECSFYVLKEEDDFVPDVNELISEITPETDMVIICNPNNPTDSVFKTEDIEKLAEACKKTGTFIMIDETYAEFADNLSEISAVPLAGRLENVFVIRGTSKFFACPGLRLGYGIMSSGELKEKINIMRDPWSVNTLSAKAGEVMFSDNDHINRTHALISAERNRLKERLSRFSGLKTYNLNSNLVLCRILKEGVYAEDIFKALLKYNIIIRSCENIAALGNEYFRFCILSPKQNDILLNGLSEFFRNPKSV